MSRYKNNWILAVILLIAAGARLGGIGYRHFPDEAYQLYISLKVGTGDLTTSWLVGVYPYLMSIWYGLFYLLGKIWGFFPSLEVFAGRYYTDPLIFYYAGRVAEALAGILGIWVGYRLARVFLPRILSCGVALLLAINLTLVEISQLARGQAFAFLFGLAALWGLARIPKRGRNPIWRWGMIGLSLAAAVSIRVFYLAYFIPLVLVVIFTWRQKRKIILLQGCLVLLLSFCVALVLFTPLKGSSEAAGHQGFPLTISNLFNTGQADPNILGCDSENGWSSYLGDILPTSLGLPLLFVSLVALVWAFMKLSRFKYAFCSIMPVVYILVMGAKPFTASRYIIPIFPLLFLAIGFMFYDLLKVREGGVRKQILGLGACFLLCLPRLPAIIEHDLDNCRLSTLDISRSWILKNIPDSSAIGVESTGYSGPNIRLYSVIDYDMYRLSPKELKQIYSERSLNDPSASKALKYFIDHPPNPWHKIYDLNVRKLVNLEWLLSEEVEFFVTSSGVRKDYETELACRKYPDIVRNRMDFYAWLESDCELVKRFRPDTKTPGPEIIIWRHSISAE